MRSILAFGMFVGVSVTTLLASTGCTSAVTAGDDTGANGANIKGGTATDPKVEGGCGGKDDPGHSGESPPPSKCWNGNVGSSKDCQDIGALKDQANQVCVGQGAVLATLDYKVDSSCPGGGTEAHEVEFSCCPPPPPPPPPPANGCWQDEVGDGVTCQDTITLKDQANAICVAKGAAMTAFFYDQADPNCLGSGTEASKAAFTCCGAEPPPPPPPAENGCWKTAVGDGVTCQSNVDLTKLAVATCTEKAAVLAEVLTDGYQADCSGTDSVKAAIVCCSELK